MTASSVRRPVLGGIERLPGLIVHGDVEQGEEGRKQRLQALVQGQQLAGDLLANLPGVVAALDAEVGLEQVDDRQIGRRLAVGHRTAFQDQPALGSVGMGELVEQARLADTGLADHGDDLAVAAAGPVERPPQGLDFGLAPDEPAEPARQGGLEARPHGRRAGQLEDLDGRLQPLDRDRTEPVHLNEPLGELQRIAGNPDGAGNRELFHPAREMRRLADGVVVHRQVVADGPHHHLARVEPDPDLHFDAVRPANLFGAAVDGACMASAA